MDDIMSTRYPPELLLKGGFVPVCPALEVFEYLCFAFCDHGSKEGMEGAETSRWELETSGTTTHPHPHRSPRPCEDIACSTVVLSMASIPTCSLSVAMSLHTFRFARVSGPKGADRIDISLW